MTSQRALTSDVFISYSRKDGDFVRRLVGALKADGYEVWVDFEDIPFATDWWQEIVVGIEGAAVAIFVLSPDSIQSEVCSLEVAHILKSNKRLIPTVWRDSGMYNLETSQFKVPKVIRSLNWIFFNDEAKFDDAYAKLRTTIDTDFAEERKLTKILVQAREWEEKDHHPGSLLRGLELEEAEQAAQGAELNELQRTFLQASRNREHAEQLAWRFIWGAVGGIVGMAWLVAGIFRGFRLSDPVSLALAFTAGQFFGLFVGLLALLSHGLPRFAERALPRQLHIGARAALCLLVGALAWMVYQWFFLGAPFALNWSKALGGLGLSGGFILTMLGKLPRVSQALRLKSGASWLPLVSVALIALCTFLPILPLNSTSSLPAIQEGTLDWLIAFDHAEQVWQVGLPLALFIALGANASPLWELLRNLQH
ncbi:MAG: toll/interleukin-1 receptor domain-containing protein [Anaerolineae bacterium]|nr:toll/interleukin-1 receptor domain-containing protein [Anaerolineae bacterium]MDW8171805.1 toll/interleukin-1 receptor domain-containing protein [Anaerolineae bacterium]